MIPSTQLLQSYEGCIKIRIPVNIAESPKKMYPDLILGVFEIKQ